MFFTDLSARHKLLHFIVIENSKFMNTSTLLTYNPFHIAREIVGHFEENFWLEANPF